MSLEKSILQTLAYFDIFDHPLTKEELFRYLISADGLRPTDYTDFLNQLEQLQHLQHLHHLQHFQHQDGFYFLNGRGQIVAERQGKVKIIEQKMKIAKRGIKKMAWVPFLRAVFVCNTVAFGSADEDSDIDVFIIVRKGRMWLTRLLVTLSLSLFGLRRTKNRIKNKICLSFYVTDDNLNLEKVATKDDLYLVYWLAQLVPMYDPESLHQSVIGANKWVEKYLLNGIATYQMSRKCKVESRKCGQIIKKILEKMWGGSYGDLIENQAKGVQQARMKMNLASVQDAPDTRVIISDSMLKFHEKDRREEYREKWLEKCLDLKISNSPNSPNF